MVKYASCPKGETTFERFCEKNSKKVKKTLKKCLTKLFGCGIIVKLSRGRLWEERERSLKIEQQERSTKRKKQVQISSKELYILNKVKEAKN